MTKIPFFTCTECWVFPIADHSIHSFTRVLVFGKENKIANLLATIHIVLSNINTKIDPLPLNSKHSSILEC